MQISPFLSKKKKTLDRLEAFVPVRTWDEIPILYVFVFAKIVLLVGIHDDT